MRISDWSSDVCSSDLVAGTNGKGSTCAYLRACLEAAGHKVHVYTSPHLVRFNERIRLAGRLIEDQPLAALLAEVLDANGDDEISFFRSEERRVGKECVSKCRSRWSPVH